MMTTRELIEAAQLDALGLLDESERDAFEAALSAAPAALKAQVRAEQARLADYDPMEFRAAVPVDLAPPPGLKEAVLRAWREALGHQAARVAVHAAVAREDSRSDAIRLRASRRVSPLWRAAAIGFMATAVVFGVVSAQMFQRYEELQATANGNNVIDWISSNGPGARQLRDILLAKSVQTVEFAPAAGFKGDAAVFFNPDWKGKAKLCCNNLPSTGGQTYKLVLLNKDGTTRQDVAPITRSDGFTVHDFEIAAADLASLAIVMVARDGGQTTVLTARA